MFEYLLLVNKKASFHKGTLKKNNLLGKPKMLSHA